jgi:hypothetical protein
MHCKKIMMLIRVRSFQYACTVYPYFYLMRILISVENIWSLITMPWVYIYVCGAEAER